MMNKNLSILIVGLGLIGAILVTFTLVNKPEAPTKEQIAKQKKGFQKARKNVLEVLAEVQRLNKQKPGSAIVRSFFDAKSDELLNMFKAAPPAAKQTAYSLLTESDPTNRSKYEQLLKR